ncbi:transcription elongation factor S-II [Allomyces macrogynus ATCC 38327]|uniref:Transcription elongation factor n=1 Tax=Allomyces macrogynus (strain ATCC 38327) TaxID=578462 RepID=A0A0L0S3Q6_ALLM3|nr:transcription elongation factor S-II [Allomyces macrogynus ATCC 38327]|eukprot:KNE57193.1 transcription elongation factor S-II [Allomyces macrogynus ATCC 38327]
MDAQVLDLKGKLQHALKDGKTALACDILARLGEIKATKDLLKKTEIGLYVTKLKKHADANVVARASAALDRWKRDVGIAPKPHAAATHPHHAAPSKPATAVTTSTSSRPAAAGPASPVPASRSAPASRPSAPSASSSQPGSTPASPRPVAAEIRRPAPAPASRTNSVSSTTSAGGGSGKERTLASDGISVPSVGDKLRDRCIEMYYNALCVDCDDESDAIMTVAVKIEKAMFAKHNQSVTAGYKNDLRMYTASIKNKQNGALRESIMNGDILPPDLVNMSAADLAPGPLRERMEEERARNLFLAQGAGNIKATTDQFRCGKCKKRRCSYFQMQTRSADEPMTTFVECLECGNNWKFC